MKPEVYFSALKKGQRKDECFRLLLEKTGPHLSRYKRGEFVGIKMTIGDKGNSGYIKPEIVRILADNLKERGAKPFVFDTNVIYTGERQNAIDHLNLAHQKGFTIEGLGCPYIIADGAFGTDSKAIKVKYRNIHEIRVPSLVEVLEDLVVLSHVTGHIMSGYAASIKNVAMGMASRAGKQMQHSSLRPAINPEHCTMCGCCMLMCPVSAISEASGRVFINSKTCIGCGECISACKFNAVSINWYEDTNVFVERMAEFADAVLSRIKRKMFIDFAFDITEECDCIAKDDPRITQDLGIFASTDILAADKACFDMLTRERDVFDRNKKTKAYMHQFEYAEKIGLGKLDYTLIAV